MKRALVLGSNSAIAQATISHLADEGWAFTLVARDKARLNVHVESLKASGVSARGESMDFGNRWAPDAIRKLVIDEAPDLILLAFGLWAENPTAEVNTAAADVLIETNFAAPARICLAIAQVLEERGRGALVVIGSVAGDRGRQSNYVYGAAKAGLGVLVEGLAHRLARRGQARAILVKPGLVRTPMTAGFDRSGVLWSSPDDVGRRIARLVRARSTVHYAPGFWRWIMMGVRALPDPIFHRTAL
jgi:decaprenylphospho-beta-D-erythro-pentofuranosid-2-ulose 2-reductase